MEDEPAAVSKNSMMVFDSGPYIRRLTLRDDDLKTDNQDISAGPRSNCSTENHVDSTIYTPPALRVHSQSNPQSFSSENG